ncbi:MAG TPA: GNAT family protein [Patescibacteria group bacterium]|nr:GNAT family protein [Patescibacteria group bacterium]
MLNLEIPEYSGFKAYPDVVTKLKRYAVVDRVSGISLMPFQGMSEQVRRSVEWELDPDISRFELNTGVNWIALQYHYEQAAENKDLALFEIILPDGTPIGNTELREFDVWNKCAYGGLMLDKSAWGRRIGTRVAELRAARAKQFGIRTLLVDIHEQNLASWLISEQFPHEKPEPTSRSGYFRFKIHLDQWQVPSDMQLELQPVGEPAGV